MSHEYLSGLRNADIGSCDPQNLVDLREIKIKHRGTRARRASEFVSRVGNPYLFRVEDTVVKLEFAGEKDFDAALLKALSAG